MASDIDHILSPRPLHTLSFQTPVRCTVWKGKNLYETIELEIYPFDTIDTLKYLIYTHYNNPDFLPRFTFVGIAKEDNFIPLDYLWYSFGAHNIEDTYHLKNPTKLQDDLRFVTDNGSYSSPNYNLRGRSTIEDVFLKSSNEQEIPMLHVFTLSALLRKYTGVKPISDEEWNKKFSPYFIDLTSSTYQPTQEDKNFGNVITSFIKKRTISLSLLNSIVERSEPELPLIKVDGIQQLQLTWKKPVDGFEGAASVFYTISATERRPYIRLLPSEGSSITKLHVKGVLPIPTIDDPRHLEVWSKEQSASPGKDMCVIKYVHRSLLTISQSIYGTIHINNDGTINLLVQPPKQIRKLNPDLDFRNFSRILQDVFIGLPQKADEFELRELTLTLKFSTKTKFNRNRILQRLPFFSSFFKEINGLPDERKFMTLRYKAVSQYATEDEIFTFITQVVTEYKIQEGEFPQKLMSNIRDEFQLPDNEIQDIIKKWLERKNSSVVKNPEDRDTTERYNPGIDIQLYSQHPLYSFQLYRINSYESYIRICTLLSILFMDNDAYFKNAPELFTKEEDLVETVAMDQEHKHDESNTEQNKNEQPAFSAFQPYDNNDDFLNEVNYENNMNVAAVK